SGIHAMAAATFEGNPVDVDFGPGSGPGAGGGGCAIGSWSGMTYLHKMTVRLSSTLAARCSFFTFILGPNPKSSRVNRQFNENKNFPPRIHFNRIALCNWDHNHSLRARSSGPHTCY